MCEAQAIAAFDFPREALRLGGHWPNQHFVPADVAPFWARPTTHEMHLAELDAQHRVELGLAQAAELFAQGVSVNPFFTCYTRSFFIGAQQ